MIEKIKAEIASKHFVQYIMAGSLGAFIDYVSFFIMLYFGVPSMVAQWLSGFFGFSHNHMWYHFKVFDHDQRFVQTYPISFVINITAILISGPMLVLLSQYLNIILSKILLTGIITVLLYLIRRKWIFVKKSS